MASTSTVSPRERILQAAVTLLDTGGVEAVSTRAVSAAADVQPPTIYRHFGDMQGLLNTAAIAGFTAFVREKAAQVPLSDPVEQVRAGWSLHIEFGLTHPHLYTAMYSAARSGEGAPAAVEAAAMLRTLMRRVAEAGRLAVGVDRAASMIHAAARGTTLSLLDAPAENSGLSELMLQAVLNAILTPEVHTSSGHAEQQGAVHAVSLAELLPNLSTPLSSAEQALLLEWLHRLM